MRRDPFGEDVRVEAADWFAKMRGPEAERLQPAFQAWRAADPANAEAYERHLQNWERSAFLANTGLAGQRNLGRVERKPFHRRYALAASVSMLLAGGTAVYILQSPAVLSARMLHMQVVTDADRRVITLDDDSRITVEARSALDLSFSPQRRVAKLKQGRVRFELARPDVRPLVVEVARSRVVAGQASFDIALKSDKVSVAMLSGAVVLEQSGAGTGPTRRLEAGDRAVLPVSAPITSSTGPEAPRSGQGMIAFTGEPVAVAIERFNRVSGRPIALGSADLGTRRISGAFRTDDPEGFAGAVVAMFGGQVEVTPGGRILIRSTSRSRKSEVG